MVDALGVSKDTVRRDFDCLSQRNLAQRTHGGILPVKNTTVLGFQERQEELTEDKKKLADLALSFVKDQSLLFFDVSTLMLEVSQKLTKSVTVYSHSLDNALVLSGKEGFYTMERIAIMSNIRLIISDIDGTILTSNHQVDEQLIEVMPELEKANIPFVLASARSPLGMQPIAHKLGLHDNPIACYNGALVLEGDRTIIQHPVDKSEIQELLSYLSTDYPSVSVNIYSGKDWITNELDKWSQLEGSITGESPIIKELQDTVSDSEPPIHKLLLIDEPEVIQDLHQKFLSMDFPQTAFYLSKDNYLEVTAKHVSKEHALLELAKYYDLPLEQVMTIGDNFNDSPMLALAGLGIAMGNAPEGVKETANLVTASNDEHGVAQAIRKHVLN